VRHVLTGHHDRFLRRRTGAERDLLIGWAVIVTCGVTVALLIFKLMVP
jgi:hypothetical protein